MFSTRSIFFLIIRTLWWHIHRKKRLNGCLCLNHLSFYQSFGAGKLTIFFIVYVNKLLRWSEKGLNWKLKIVPHTFRVLTHFFSLSVLPKHTIIFFNMQECPLSSTPCSLCCDGFKRTLHVFCKCHKNDTTTSAGLPTSFTSWLDYVLRVGVRNLSDYGLFASEVDRCAIVAAGNFTDVCCVFPVLSFQFGSERLTQLNMWKADTRLFSTTCRATLQFSSPFNVAAFQMNLRYLSLHLWIENCYRSHDGCCYSASSFGQSNMFMFPFV